LSKLFGRPKAQSANKEQQQNLPPTLSNQKLNNNGIAWLVQSTLASWLCIASALAKIAWLCAMINPRADQTGGKVSDKHVYDNPFDPLVSVFLALGIWFSLESVHFGHT
jgi:hypothetical protein